MLATFESLQKTLQNERVLWIGFPQDRPLLSPAPGCALPDLYISLARPNHWYLSFDPESGYAKDLVPRLGSLVGPYELIVLSKAFLHRNGLMLRALRVALLKLCHHASRVVVEGVWRSYYDQDQDQQSVAKVLDEIARVLALSTPGAPIGRTSRNEEFAGERRSRDLDPRSKYEDRIRERWRGLEVSRAPKTIAVIGGGIAGVTIALACLRRGHQVELFESNIELLRQGSNQPLLATYPNFSKDGNNLSLLTQYSLRLLTDSPYSELLLACGRFEPAGSRQEAEGQRALVQKLALPQELLQFLSGTQCQTFWDPFVSALAPASVEEASLQRAHPSARLHGGLWIALAAQLDVNQLRQHVGQIAVDQSSQFKLHLGQVADVKQIIKQFDCVVVTAGEGTPQLIAETSIGLNLQDHAAWKVYRGSSFSVSTKGDREPNGHRESLSDAFSQGLGVAVGDALEDKSAHQAMIKEHSKPLAIIGGAVSLQEISSHTWLIGSSYTDATQAQPSEETQWQQLMEGARLLTGSDLRSFAKLQVHRGSRCVVPDRMPLIGPLVHPSPRKSWPAQGDPQAQLYLASAFGSRGLLWAHLAAQLITDHIDGISPRIGLKALKSIDPFRYSEKIRTAP